MKSALLLLLLLAALCVACFVGASKIGDGTVSIELVTHYTGLQSVPTAIRFLPQFPPSNVPAMFVVEQHGRIVWFDETASTPVANTFLDITDKVLNREGTQGLLGVAFHPGFHTNGLFYVWYNPRHTNQTPGCHCNTTLWDSMTRLQEFKYDVTGANPTPKSKRMLLQFRKPFDGHNSIDNIAFNPIDNRLYVSIGDSGCVYDPFKMAQNPDKLFGKIISIDIRHLPKSTSCRNVLISGTFSELQLKCPGLAQYVKLMGLGIRNPGGLRFYSPDQDSTNMIFVDVGNKKAEEVNVVSAPNARPSVVKPSNYGWSALEGFTCIQDEESSCPNFVPDYLLPTTLCTNPALTVKPVAVAEHGDDRLEPVTAFIGGDIYTGSDFECLRNTYVFAEYEGHLLSTDPEDGSPAYVNALRPEDSDGLFITSMGISPTNKKVFVGGVIGSEMGLLKLKSVDCP